MQRGREDMTTQTLTRPQPAASGPPPRSRGRVLLIVLSWLVVALGLLGLGSGGVVLVADAVARDADGYVMSRSVSWTSPGYAVQSETALIHGDPMGFTIADRTLGKFRAEATPTGDHGVFIGIAPAPDVVRYLRHVARTTVPDPWTGPSTGDFVDGGSPRVAPTDADFWVTSSVGTGPQSITWEPEPGRWRLVVMNVEGTTPVSADVAVGAEVPVLRTAGWTAVGAGALVLLIGVAALAASLRRRPDGIA